MSLWEVTKISGLLGDILGNLLGLVMKDQAFCTICGTGFDRHGAIDICSQCLNRLDLIGSNICEYCGCPLEIQIAKRNHSEKTFFGSVQYFFRDTKPVCSRCLESELHFKSRSPLLYDGYVRELLLSFKFDGRYTLAEAFSQLMAQYLIEARPYQRLDCIVPVPLHPKKLEERGYNQSRLLAEGVSKRLGIPTVQGLIRIVEGKPQSLTDKRDRRTNIRGSFIVPDKGVIKNRRILLIDDIYTTGATASECASIMIEGGAVSVDCLTAAVVNHGN